MSPSKRIALNIVATYGRSLYALIIGLFCGRWTLMTLGEVNLGLMGVVGGLTAFIGLLNGVMASGIGRFYAISVGLEKKDPVEGLEESHRWFTTAVVVHSILPVILILAGYPLGVWAVRHYLTIPPDRIQDCVWVWRFVCVSTFVGMVVVPFSGWYGAKQEIAELTIYSFITTTLNFGFMYYAVNHPGDWLVPISCWSMLLTVVPQIIICCRAGILYPECRFKWRYFLKCGSSLKQMLAYSGWLIFGLVAELLAGQGVNIFVNKMFGPRVNAASGIGSTLSGHCATLSGSMIGAFCPAIMNAYGAGEIEVVKRYAARVSKLAMMCIMIFAIPLMLEVDEVLVLWLKTPPRYTAGLCICGLIYMLIDKISWGDCITVYATGKVSTYQMVVGGIHFCVLPLTWVLYKFNFGVYSAGIALIMLRVLVVVLRPIFTRVLLGFSFREWFGRVAVPITVTGFVGVACGWFCRQHVEASFMRIALTTVCVNVPMLALAWYYVMNRDEKAYLAEFVKRRLHFK